MALINVEQVRRLPHDSGWTLSKTDQGWIARTDDATLVCVNAKKIRYFKSLDRAVARLREEIGVREFEVRIA